MKIAGAVLISLFVGVSGLAQSRSVWLEDLTTTEVQAAVSTGMTTAIYYASALHQSGPAIVLGKHMFQARYQAQRIADELGNALILPIDPYAPGSPTGGDPKKKEGHLRFSGSTSVTDVTFGTVVREVVTSVIVSTGFKNVVIIAEHGYGLDTLKKVAEDLDSEWKSKGTHVYYIPVWDEFEGKGLGEYLTKRNILKQHAAIGEASELMSIEGEHPWVRQDKIAPEIRDVVSSELGRTFTDMKVSIAVQHIRRLISNK